MSASNLGVALTRCYFCGEGDRIVLNTRLTPTMAARVEEMNNKVLDMEPCQKCQDLMKRGVILITIDSAKSDPGWNKPPEGHIQENDTIIQGLVSRGRLYKASDHWMPNPYRTGGWFVVIDDFIKRMELPPEMEAFALKRRFMFIEHQAAENMGLFAATPTEKE